MSWLFIAVVLVYCVAACVVVGLFAAAQIVTGPAYEKLEPPPVTPPNPDAAGSPDPATGTAGSG